MHTKTLMSVSAVFTGAVGIIATFLPDEILLWLGALGTPALAILIQITGALYFGFAITNWMARGVIIGGIYSRPLALGNFAHFIIAGIALMKAAFAHPGLPWLWAAAVVYALFAMGFGLVLFRHPELERKASI